MLRGLWVKWCSIWVVDAFSTLLCGIMLGMLVGLAMASASEGNPFLAKVFILVALPVIPVASALAANLNAALNGRSDVSKPVPGKDAKPQGGNAI